MRESVYSKSEFYLDLRSLNGISPIWGKLLDLIQSVYDPDSELLDLFCIYFSLLDDGNTCIHLENDELNKQWEEKWKGLIVLNNKTEIEDKDYDFSLVIQKGIKAISSNPDLVGDEMQNSPFVVFGKWLFARKFFHAKRVIEQRIKILFNSCDNDVIIDTDEINRSIHAINPELNLEEEQLLAIGRGQDSNLIITGGPGTGKTTTVFYLLWNLLSSERYKDHRIYLAAPSGKAANRMVDSIQSSINQLKEEYRSCKTAERIREAGSFTIHRLLKYSPKKDEFTYGKENQFPKESIFVFDEASMIDVELFASLLAAIPEGARVFILGDRDQLPSVDAGAVLGNLLAEMPAYSVQSLTKSRRFKEGSPIYNLAQWLNGNSNNHECGAFVNWNIEDFKQLCSEKNSDFPVKLFSLAQNNKVKQVKDIAHKWYETFIKEIDGILTANDINRMDYLWNSVADSRILCAEKEGTTSVSSLNSIIRILAGKDKIININGHFPGEELIITKNQTVYGGIDLYNGDCGVVVSFKEKPELLYLMLEKKIERNENQAIGDKILVFGNYAFFSLDLIDSSTLDTAYAITIHKSQGSEYGNILVFLPTKKGHPLLNRQLVYTAITRTKGRTIIIANQESLDEAKQKLVVRNTGIEIK